MTPTTIWPLPTKMQYLTLLSALNQYPSHKMFGYTWNQLDTSIIIKVWSLKIILTRTILLYLEENPCNPSTDYSFTACVRNSMSKAVGCRLPWDDWTDASLPICSTIEQAQNISDIYYKYCELSQLSDIVSQTNCYPPYQYITYELTKEVSKNYF